MLEPEAEHVSLANWGVEWRLSSETGGDSGPAENSVEHSWAVPRWMNLRND